MRTGAVCLVAMVAAGVSAPTQGGPPKAEAKRAEVLVLGTYHMASPGHDVYNLQVDDVLASSRREVGQEPHDSS